MLKLWEGVRGCEEFVGPRPGSSIVGPGMLWLCEWWNAHDRASQPKCGLPLLKPCTVDGVLHTTVAPVSSVAWSAIPTPRGSLYGNSSDGGAATYSSARAVSTPSQVQ